MNAITCNKIKERGFHIAVFVEGTHMVPSSEVTTHGSIRVPGLFHWESTCMLFLPRSVATTVPSGES